MKSANPRSKLPKRALLATAVASTFVATAPVQAFEATLSGQINRIVNYIDDGVDTGLLFQDCTCTGTRFRMVGSQDVQEGWKAGGNIELQFQSNASDQTPLAGEMREEEPPFAGVRDGNVSGPSTNDGRLRKADIWISSPFGKLSLGQGDGAANGTSEHDLSDTWIASYNAPSGPGGQLLREEGSGAAGPSVFAVTSQYDGLSRNDRIRYDTPVLGPVTFAVSAGHEFQEVAGRLFWEGGGGTQLSGGLGIVQSRPAGIDIQYNASLSILFPFGFNITGSFGERSRDPSAATVAVGREDSDTWHLKLGWRFGANFKHAVSVAAGLDSDRRISGEEADRLDLAYIYNFADGVKLYAGYNLVSVDSPGAVQFEDMTSIFAGGRFTF
ncbi:MAG: porin [Gammaproteobacteria bacterium]